MVIIGGGLTFLAGGWLVAAPFTAGHQPRGHAWTAATTGDVAAGGLLMAVALTAVFVAIAGAAADLYAPRRAAG